jgi:glycogen operon protein
MLALFASRICGSADIYTKSGKGPEASINFITCHDGFTLNDLVSYRDKHNDANGEDNHDGSNANFSENCGYEGETTDAGIEALRKRRIKNFLLTLLVSRGVPMLLAGDEFRRTQGGNNNAYCQDNETSWVDWANLEQHQEIHRFAHGMLAFRRAHPVLSQEHFYTDDEIRWFNPQLGSPNWADPKCKQFACLIDGNGEDSLYLLFNAGSEEASFGLPPLPMGYRWYLAADTSRSAPQDLPAAGEETFLDNSTTYLVASFSSVILLARKQKPAPGRGTA